MPTGFIKNTIYAAALPFFGKKCEWNEDGSKLSCIYHRARTVGACFQDFHQGELSSLHCFGFSELENMRKVTGDTIFRTASLTKTVIALLVMRLQTLRLLDTREDISDFWTCPIRNPNYPDCPITLGMLLSHTSSIVDSPSYFRSYHENISVSELLKDRDSYSANCPGSAFRYSNFAAGMAACLLEARFHQSIEELLQEYLLNPIRVSATLDITRIDPALCADDWRILPPRLCFSIRDKLGRVQAIDSPDPERHYLLAAGGLLISAPMLARLCLLIPDGGNGFLDEKSLSDLKTPQLAWPEKEIPLRHAMGLFRYEKRELYGHQGFAYGAVNGLFLDKEGNGFVSLTNGASEQRIGHLSVLNHQLTEAFFEERG